MGFSRSQVAREGRRNQNIGLVLKNGANVSGSVSFNMEVTQQRPLRHIPKGRTNAYLRPLFYDKSAFFTAGHCDIFLLRRALQSGVYCEGRGPPKSHAANSVTAAVHQNPM